MRHTIHSIISSKSSIPLSKAYHFIMVTTILISLYPLTTKTPSHAMLKIEQITTVTFFIDYLLRWATADHSLHKGKFSFIYYPFTYLAITDLLSLLPSIFLFHHSLKLFKIVRLGRLLRVFRFVRYSKNISILYSVLQKQRDSLLIVGALAIGYIFLSALLIFNLEPQTFTSFFDAVYWATISLTTVGYGDIFAISLVGKIITMISSLLGVAIVALPAGIITAGYLEEIQNRNNK